MDQTYYEALAFCQKSTREDGIDAALIHNGTKLSALLVPPEVGQTYQIAAQAGKFREFRIADSYGLNSSKSSMYLAALHLKAIPSFPSFCLKTSFKAPSYLSRPNIKKL